ncbi:hypothetical protein [Niveibacterium sp. SC-1]|uniref:hypothetical protein n=1 Tax=Niveibacterium sp. SC-1 TaxID=3135646 RepID=UPI00311EE5FF
MKQVKRWFSVWSIAALVLMLAACVTDPVLNVQDQLVPTRNGGGELSLAEIERAIVAGAQKKGWLCRSVQPGLVEASITVRNHSAAVQIPYSTRAYSIRYVSSSNLDYDGSQIHHNYNNWVLNLSRAIQAELAAASRGG